MKQKKLAITLILTVMLLSVAVIGSVHAATDYDAKIQTANQKKKELEQKKENLQNQIKELEKDKSDVLKYIGKLDTKMGEVTNSLNVIKAKIKVKEEQLTKTKQELITAEKTEKAQYETMLKRIKYMYENGNSEYMDLVFEAKSLGELLNHTEYIEKISEYDRNMLARYQKTRREISEKKKGIENAIEELTGLQDEANAERQALRELTDNKKSELSKYNQNIELSNEKKEAYEKEVAKQETEVENLLLAKQRQIEREEAARKAAEKAAQEATGNDNGSTNNQSNTDQYSGASGLRWPLHVSGRITSTFGSRKSPTEGASSNHKGIDIAVATGTPIVAAGDGKVVTAAYSSSAGNYLMIYHGNSTYTVYMHCSSLAVGNGASVKKGQLIAYVGSTGVSTGSHLHFGIMINGSYVDPLNYVRN